MNVQKFINHPSIHIKYHYIQISSYHKKKIRNKFNQNERNGDG